jgi:hypothetical protein
MPPPLSAEFSETVESDTVTVPLSLLIAPPLPPVVFFVMLVRATVTFPEPLLSIPPPFPSNATLSEIVESVTVTVPAVSSSPWFSIALPPCRPATSPFPDTRLPATVSEPPALLLSALPAVAKLSVSRELTTRTLPAPWLSIPPPLLPATLPSIALSLTTTLAGPALRMAPPCSAV